jgi:hypothetical protein
MTVKKVESPYIEGLSSEDESTRIRVHLREVETIEVYGKSVWVGLLRVGRFTFLAAVAFVFIRSITR